VFDPTFGNGIKDFFAAFRLGDESPDVEESYVEFGLFGAGVKQRCNDANEMGFGFRGIFEVENICNIFHEVASFFGISTGKEVNSARKSSIEKDAVVFAGFGHPMQ
jgi:hypothetical protein